MATACHNHQGRVCLISHQFPCCHCKQGGADVLKAAIVRPSDTSKPAFVPEDRALAVKQRANLTHCRGAPGRFSQFGACTCLESLLQLRFGRLDGSASLRQHCPGT